MKKVGIITYYYKSHNIGGLLQAYALCYAVKKLGYNAEQICYDESVKTAEQIEENRKLRSEQIKSSSIHVVTKKLLWKIKSKIYRVSVEDKIRIEKQWKRFDEFADIIPHSDKVYTALDIERANENYDIFICGSDVVWHPSNLIHSAYYLSFVDEDKVKFSYAASFGRLPYTKIEKEKIRDRVSKLDQIGVRENSGEKYIEENYGFNAQTVFDPTMLLTKEEWKEVETNAIIPTEEYIFCYFLGEQKWVREYVSRFAKQQKLKIVYLPYIMNKKRESDESLKKHSYGLYDVDPRDVITLIDRAKYVFTDSFHGAVFSTIFEKDFYTFDRDKANEKSSINSRINDFLQILNMKDRHVESFDQGPLKGEFAKYSLEMNELIRKKRAKSYDFLQRGLNIEKED